MRLCPTPSYPSPFGRKITQICAFKVKRVSSLITPWTITRVQEIDCTCRKVLLCLGVEHCLTECVDFTLQTRERELFNGFYVTQTMRPWQIVSHLFHTDAGVCVTGPVSFFLSARPPFPSPKPLAVFHGSFISFRPQTLETWLNTNNVFCREDMKIHNMSPALT